MNQTVFWERMVAGIGIGLLLGILGVLVYEAFQPNQPPVLVITPERTVANAAGYLVQIHAANQGDEPAAEILVEGVLLPSGQPDGEPVETSELTLDFVPAQSQRRGGLFFTHNPAEYQLELRAKSYRVP
jgi:uncharacterized protein (TIGR02588 family)